MEFKTSLSLGFVRAMSARRNHRSNLTTAKSRNNGHFCFLLVSKVGSLFLIVLSGPQRCFRTKIWGFATIPKVLSSEVDFRTSTRNLWKHCRSSRWTAHSVIVGSMVLSSLRGISVSDWKIDGHGMMGSSALDFAAGYTFSGRSCLRLFREALLQSWSDFWSMPIARAIVKKLKHSGIWLQDLSDNKREVEGMWESARIISSLRSAAPLPVSWYTRYAWADP